VRLARTLTCIGRTCLVACWKVLGSRSRACLYMRNQLGASASTSSPDVPCGGNGTEMYLRCSTITKIPQVNQCRSSAPAGLSLFCPNVVMSVTNHILGLHPGQATHPAEARCQGGKVVFPCHCQSLLQKRTFSSSCKCIHALNVSSSLQSNHVLDAWLIQSDDHRGQDIFLQTRRSS
jgi:hypothetical protein